MTIFDLVESKAIAMYWQEQESNRIPFLGEALFPARKKVGLDLSWLKGSNDLPIALMPSAFDAKPTLRDRIGVQRLETELPFFREAMRIGEKDRQKILQFLNNVNSQYLTDAIQKIYDDASKLIAGARVQPERMRMSLLVDGKISIVAPNDKGVTVQYNYDYDPEGTWRAANTQALAGDDMWSAAATSNPIQDILNVKRTMRVKYGVEITRAICTTKTWAYLMTNQAIKNDMNVLQGSRIILTDGMLQTYLLQKTGVNFVIYDKMYKNEAGVAKQYYPDNYVTFLPDYSLGSTYFATTPEEADLMSGALTDASVSIVDTGVAVLTKKESLPVNVITSVSEIVLPSFERMDDVYVIHVSNVGE